MDEEGKVLKNNETSESDEPKIKESDEFDPLENQTKPPIGFHQRSNKKTASMQSIAEEDVLELTDHIGDVSLKSEEDLKMKRKRKV